MDVFVEARLDAFADAGPAGFLQGKVKSYRERLQNAKEAIWTFRAQNRGFVDGGDTLLRERSDLDSSLRDAGNEIAGLREKLSLLRQQAATTSAAAEAERDPLLTQLEQELLKLQLEEQCQLGRFREDSRAVASVRAQIELVQERLGHREIALAEAGARADPQSAIQSVEVYLGFREACLSEETNREKIANTGAIEKPVPPYEPVVPRTRVNLALGALLGIGLGLTLAFVVDSPEPFAR